jgi:hypothetical protein
MAERTEQGTQPAADVPPAGEEVHLPGNTILPLILTVGITLVLIGLTTWIGFIIAGALITLWATVRWIRDTRHDVGELPPEAH